MKKANPYTLLFFFLAVIFFSACSPDFSESPIVGKWKIKDGPFVEPSVMEFRSNGDFWLNYGRDIVNDVIGTYAVEGNQVTLYFTKGLDEPGCKDAGVYTFSRASDELRFSLVRDFCAARISNHLYPWYKTERYH